jgi:hypothetical protein
LRFEANRLDEISISDVGRFPCEVTPEFSANDKISIVDGTLLINGVPLPQRSSVPGASIRIESPVCVVQWHWMIPVNPAIYRKRKMLFLFVPRCRVFMRSEYSLNLEDCRQSSLRLMKAKGPFVGHVSDNIATFKSRSEPAGAAKAGNRGILMGQIRFAANRTVNEWRQLVRFGRLTPRSGTDQRIVAYEKESWWIHVR